MGHSAAHRDFRAGETTPGGAQGISAMATLLPTLCPGTWKIPWVCLPGGKSLAFLFCMKCCLVQGPSGSVCLCWDVSDSSVSTVPVCAWLSHHLWSLNISVISAASFDDINNVSILSSTAVYSNLYLNSAEFSISDVWASRGRLLLIPGMPLFLWHMIWKFNYQTNYWFHWNLQGKQ